MTLKLTRRRFGQLTFATTVMGGLGGLPDKAFAQTPRLIIVGVEHGSIVRNYSQNKEDLIENIDGIDDETRENYAPVITEDYAMLAPSNTPASTIQGIVLQFFDLQTGKVTRRTVSAPLLSPGERLTGLTYLANGTLIVAITPDSAGANGAEPTRLIFLNQSLKTIAVSGLQAQEALDSLLLLQDGSIIGLVTKKDGSSPAKIADVNSNTGKISFSNRINLPTGMRFSCLVQHPNGKLYTTVFRPNTNTELIELDLAHKKVAVVANLKLDDVLWYHGIQSLVCSPSGQLFALANLEYRLPNSLYTVEVNTGAMTKLTDFEASRMTAMINASVVVPY